MEAVEKFALWSCLDNEVNFGGMLTVKVITPSKDFK